MRPLDGKPTRRGMRRAMRGTPTGRRATHRAQTTYGRHQRDADHRARWALNLALIAALRGQNET